MTKARTKFVCSECGSESPKWMGKCPECGQWNTFVEELEQKDSKVHQRFAGTLAKPESLLEISDNVEERLSTGNSELDRVLGGGIVKGSLVLVGGDPGIGKSTLLLQIANNIGIKGFRVLYVSGEESTSQIKLRAFRMDIRSGNIFLIAENNIRNVDIYVRDKKPDILVVDSIQTMYDPDISSAPGSVSQVREATLGLMKIAKQDGIATFIVGHVTKQGAIAGPRVLEHMVDTVLYFEGETHMSYRVLRAVKNRFGSTNEIGIFEMGDKGLVEVLNPSEMLLSGRMKGSTGSCVISTMEGTRAMLVEVQALLSHSRFGVPRRNATGVDYNRVALLMAVLEKRVGMQLGSSDSYVNVVGGIRINEPAADLGIIAAIASSFRDKEIEGSTVIIGEVGLSGEVRAVNFAEKRVNEAAKLGFKRCIIPENNLLRLNDKSGIEVLGVSNVNDTLDIILC